MHPGVFELAYQACPIWEAGKYICRDDLAKFRGDYVETLEARVPSVAYP